MQIKINLIIQKIVEKLIKEYNPIKIVLFESYNRGPTHRDSDIDLLIIKQTEKRPVDRFVEVKKILYNPSLKTLLSPIILTPKELETRITLGDTFFKEIIEEGVILYDRFPK